MKRFPIALAVAGLVATPALAAKPVSKKAARKPSPVVKAPTVKPAPAQEEGLEPVVQFKRPGSKPIVKAAPVLGTPAPKVAVTPPPAASRLSAPGLPVSTLPTEEVDAYGKEIARASQEIDALLTRLDKSATHKASPPAEGAKALAAQRERMQAILKDEKVSKGDQAKLEELVRQRADSLYMMSASLILTNRTNDALDYLHEVMRSQPEDSHLYRAAQMQVKALHYRPD